MAIRATVERETMALKATSEPILMRERTMVKQQEKNMELTGMWRVGWTWYMRVRLNSLLCETAKWFKDDLLLRANARMEAHGLGQKRKFAARLRQER